MRLEELLSVIKPMAVFGPLDEEVTGLAYNSQRVAPGDAFFALPGARLDGAQFISQALERGARVIVSERGPAAPSPVTHLQVREARLAMALAAHAFFGQPTRRLRLIGVTGTSGKTTVTYALEAILKATGQKVGVVGSVNYRHSGSVLPAPVTTPESVDLVRLLDEMAQGGIETVVTEVTSHALDQRRVSGCRFEAVCFTNLSRDHLDYHPDMESYFQAKRRLFTDFAVRGRTAVNVDDAYGRRLKEEMASGAITFGLDHRADVTAEAVHLNGRGIKAQIITPAGRLTVSSPLVGWINLMNLLSAAALAWLLGLSLEVMAEGLNHLRVVPGRMEDVGRPFGRRVIVDYSHKVEALTRALEVARTFTPGRIITVFGCGGDRDQGKRPMMGRVAAEKSEVVIVTSDNPRTEDPQAILDQIARGFQDTDKTYFPPEEKAAPERGGYTLLEDRRAAIRLAVRMAQEADTVMICGKGHEDYQIVGFERRHLDDREEAVKALEELEGGAR